MRERRSLSQKKGRLRSMIRNAKTVPSNGSIPYERRNCLEKRTNATPIMATIR